MMLQGPRGPVFSARGQGVISELSSKKKEGEEGVKKKKKWEPGILAGVAAWKQRSPRRCHLAALTYRCQTHQGPAATAATLPTLPRRCCGKRCRVSAHRFDIYRSCLRVRLCVCVGNGVWMYTSIDKELALS